jgi:hypothetical protein
MKWEGSRYPGLLKPLDRNVRSGEESQSSTLRSGASKSVISRANDIKFGARETSK